MGYTHTLICVLPIPPRPQLKRGRPPNPHHFSNIDRTKDSHPSKDSVPLLLITFKLEKMSAIVAASTTPSTPTRPNQTGDISSTYSIPTTPELGNDDVHSPEGISLSTPELVKTTTELSSPASQVGPVTPRTTEDPSHQPSIVTLGSPISLAATNVETPTKPSLHREKSNISIKRKPVPLAIGDDPLTASSGPSPIPRGQFHLTTVDDLVRSIVAGNAPVRPPSYTPSAHQPTYVLTVDLPPEIEVERAVEAERLGFTYPPQPAERDWEHRMDFETGRVWTTPGRANEFHINGGMPSGEDDVLEELPTYTKDPKTECATLSRGCWLFGFVFPPLWGLGMCL